jgi:hypothetical protein
VWKELTLTLRKRPIVGHLRVWLSLRPWISSRLALNGKISRAQNDLQESQRSSEGKWSLELYLVQLSRCVFESNVINEKYVI